MENLKQKQATNKMEFRVIIIDCHGNEKTIKKSFQVLNDFHKYVADLDKKIEKGTMQSYTITSI